MFAATRKTTKRKSSFVNSKEKRRPTQPEWPKWDRKIFRRCINLSLYKPQTPSGDMVAVL